MTKINRIALSLTACTALGAAVFTLVPQNLAFARTQMDDGKTTKSDKDIIEVATGEGMEKVTTLVAAIKAAGLVDALKGDGPFTVFAPTNEAFAKLPAGTVDELLKPENKDKLTKILLHHVHKGDAVKAADVKTMALDVMDGGKVDVKVEGGTVTVGGAKVIKTDVVAKNGIIHWVDTVILPTEDAKSKM